jgi:hypothetical protein
MPKKENRPNGHSGRNIPQNHSPPRQFNGARLWGVLGIAAIAAAVFTLYPLDANQTLETDNNSFGGYQELIDLHKHIDSIVEERILSLESRAATGSADTELGVSRGGNFHRYRKNMEYFIEFLRKLIEQKIGFQGIEHISLHDNRAIMRYLRILGDLESEVPEEIRDAYHSFILSEFPLLGMIFTEYHIPNGEDFPHTFRELYDNRVEQTVHERRNLAATSTEKCSFCNKVPLVRKLGMCTCKRAKYCSKECQKKDWPVHSRTDHVNNTHPAEEHANETHPAEEHANNTQPVEEHANDMHPAAGPVQNDHYDSQPQLFMYNVAMIVPPLHEISYVTLYRESHNEDCDYIVTYKVELDYYNAIPESFGTKLRSMMAVFLTQMSRLRPALVDRDVLIELFMIITRLRHNSRQWAAQTGRSGHEVEEYLQSIVNKIDHSKSIIAMLKGFKIENTEMNEWMRKMVLLCKTNFKDVSRTTSFEFIFIYGPSQASVAYGPFDAGDADLAYKAYYEIDFDIHSMVDQTIGVSTVENLIAAIATIISLKSPEWPNGICENFAYVITEMYTNLVRGMRRRYPDNEALRNHAHGEFLRVIRTIPNGEEIFRVVEAYNMLHSFDYTTWIRPLIGGDMDTHPAVVDLRHQDEGGEGPAARGPPRRNAFGGCPPNIRE